MKNANVGFKYDLSPEGMDLLERWATEYSHEMAPDASVVGLVVPYDSTLANFVRTGEQRIFKGLGEDYDFKLGMAPYEERSEFLLTVDQRPEVPTRRVVHAKRMVAAKDDVGTASWDGLTGIEMIDDRLRATDAEEHMGLQDLLTASKLTIDGLKNVVNVATNFITKRSERGIKGLGMLGAVYSYHFLVNHAHNKGTEAIVAYQNNMARDSIGRLGAESYLLGGKPFHLPKTSGGYDYNYEALVIPGSERNLDIFLGRTDGLIRLALGTNKTALLLHEG